MTQGEATARCARHPEAEAAGTCVRCGAFACAACVRPGLDGRSYCVACEPFMPVALPWDGKGNVLRRWLSTVWAMLTKPNVTLARAAPDGSPFGALGFALLAGVVGWLPTWVSFGALTSLSVLGRGAPKQELGAYGTTGMSVAIAGLYGFVTIASAVVGPALLSLVEHAIVGGFGKGTPWSVSLRAHALSYAPALLGLLPCCAWPAMLIWSVPLRVLALERFHGCTRTRATLAVMTPVTVVALGVLALSLASAVIIQSLMPKG